MGKNKLKNEIPNEIEEINSQIPDYLNENTIEAEEEN